MSRLTVVDDFVQIRLYFVTQLELKEKEKIDKYQDLARELRKLSKLSIIAPSTKFTPTHFFLPNSSSEHSTSKSCPD